MLGWNGYVQWCSNCHLTCKADHVQGFGTNWKGMMCGCTKEDTFELLDTFYDLGSNFVDAANIYQGGQSEEWIGEWMQKTGRRDDGDIY